MELDILGCIKGQGEEEARLPSPAVSVTHAGVLLIILNKEGMDLSYENP